MREPDEGTLTSREQQAVQRIVGSIAELARFLNETPIPDDLSPSVLYGYLARMKAIQGNTDNGVSLMACLLAKAYLNRQLKMASFDVADKAQGAAGLDIDARTTTGARVIAEIKTTTPYGTNDLGNAQRSSFEKDFNKLNRETAEYRFFFVTDPRTFELMRTKYASKIPGVCVVLLPGGESFVA